ncbi:nucleotidyltransferase family protein [Brevibacillus massiliensis]|uniref:nucleotidyltransferase family protein n=1 Tax=Brevibacillus massiliensis TaxID=1118054 RepID=UPI0002D3E57B|nr:nucleotidyltransferase family protein [Brevibacillus massiliensis]
MKPQVSAVILAAGMSTRMGEPKQLLKLGGSCLLERVIRQVLAAKVAEVIAVIGYRAEEIQREIRIADSRFRWVVNPAFASGQSSSLVRGMQAAAHPAVMVFLADLPLIADETIQSVMQRGAGLLSEWQEPFVVQPAFQGDAGHPVFFGNVDAEAFHKLEGDQGAKPILGTMRQRIRIPVDDPGILFDIDTREAYRQALWMLERKSSDVTIPGGEGK